MTTRQFEILNKRLFLQRYRSVFTEKVYPSIQYDAIRSHWRYTDHWKHILARPLPDPTWPPPKYKKGDVVNTEYGDDSDCCCRVTSVAGFDKKMKRWYYFTTAARQAYPEHRLTT